MDGDRQVVRPKPLVQPSRVSGQLDPRHPALTGAWMRGAGCPLDEERQARLRDRLGDACEPPAQLVAGAVGDFQPEARRDGFDVVGADGPAEWAAVGRRRDPAAELTPGRLGFVDDVDELQVAAVERQDSVGGSPARMATALDALVVEAADEYVVERDQAGCSAITPVAARGAPDRQSRSRGGFPRRRPP
jgi:hypothetical protein